MDNGFVINLTNELFSCMNGYATYTIEKTGVLESTEEMKKQEILQMYGEHGTIRKTMWFAEKEGYWYWSKPDSTKKKGFTNVKRRKKEDIEKLICDYYMQLEQEQEIKDLKENMTLEALFFEFMEHKAQLVKAGTIKRMMTDWTRYYKTQPDFINKPFRSITKIDIDNFFNTILNQTPLKDKAFHNMCGLLKQTLEYAVDAEYIEKNPYRVNVNKRKVTKTQKKSSKQEVYTQKEEELLLADMERRLSLNPNNTVPLAVMLDFELGTRRGEIMALCNSDIQGNKIHISKQVVEEFDISDLNNIKVSGYKAVNYTKSEDGDRWIPLTPKAKEIIARVQEINKRTGECYEDFLFVRNGYLIPLTCLYDIIKEACKHTGVEKKGTHKIRKTYGSKLFNNNVPLSHVKDLLGHADERTTLKYYIFNTLDETESDNLVIQALQGEPKTTNNVRERERKIIPFPITKKEENPCKLKVFH